jgi:hypothetical protein
VPHDKGFKNEKKQLRNEALQVQLKSTHAKLQETKRNMVDFTTLESRLQGCCLPLETLFREMEDLQQGCACAMLHGAKKKVLNIGIVVTNLHTNRDVLESLSFDKEIF